MGMKAFRRVQQEVYTWLSLFKEEQGEITKISY